MSEFNEELQNKRGPSSPLSEGEEMEVSGSRRSRMKRINLDDMIDDLSPSSKARSADSLNTKADTRNDGEQNQDLNTNNPEIIHTEDNIKVPVTLESPFRTKSTRFWDT